MKSRLTGCTLGLSCLWFGYTFTGGLCLSGLKAEPAEGRWPGLSGPIAGPEDGFLSPGRCPGRFTETLSPGLFTVLLGFLSTDAPD